MSRRPKGGMGAGRKKVAKQEPLVSEAWGTLATTVTNKHTKNKARGVGRNTYKDRNTQRHMAQLCFMFSSSSFFFQTISMLETVGAINEEANEDCIEEAANLAELNKKRMVRKKRRKKGVHVKHMRLTHTC